MMLDVFWFSTLHFVIHLLRLKTQTDTIKQTIQNKSAYQ